MLYTKELNRKECLEFLKNSNFGRIACSNNNQPYIVTFNFAHDSKEYLYAFSTIGQKILWMRENPQVCVEIEDITSQVDWTTLIVFGTFEELSGKSKDYAHELLSNRPMWWKPAYLAGIQRTEIEEKPVYFRIHIKKMTGKRIFSQEIEEVIANGKTVKAAKLSTRGLW